MTFQFKKIYILLYYFLFLNLYSFSQESNINKRFNIQAGYSQREYINAIWYNTLIDSSENMYEYSRDSIEFNKTKVPVKSLSCNYGYSNHFEMGFSLIFTSHKNFNIPIFNVQQKIHFFPYSQFSKKIDFYIPYSVGICFDLDTKKIYLTCFDIALGGTYYISKNVGIFTEIHTQSIDYYLCNPYFQFGLSYAWHTKQKSNE